MYQYTKALLTGKYWFSLGPGLTLLGLGLIPFHHMLSDYAPIEKWFSVPYLNPFYLTGGFTIAIFTALWLGYDLVNQQLEKLDADNLKRSPEARMDRAYRLIHQLIIEGDELFAGNADPDQIQRWDERVLITLADWCNENAQQFYKWNSRPEDQELIRDPLKALEELKHIHSILNVFIKSL